MNRTEKQIQDKLKGFEHEVKPEIWNSIQSGLPDTFAQKIQSKFNSYQLVPHTLIWNKIKNLIPKSLEQVLKSKFQNTSAPVANTNWQQISEKLAQSKQFEAQMQRKLSDVQYPVSPVVWNSISTHIAKSKKYFYNYQRAAAAILLLISFAGLHWLNTNPSQQFGNQTPLTLSEANKLNENSKSEFDQLQKSTEKGSVQNGSIASVNNSENNNAFGSSTQAIASNSDSKTPNFDTSRKATNSLENKQSPTNSNGENYNSFAQNGSTNSYLVSRTSTSGFSGAANDVGNSDAGNMLGMSQQDFFTSALPVINLLSNKKKISLFKKLPLKSFEQKFHLDEPILRTKYALGISFFGGNFLTPFKTNENSHYSYKENDDYDAFANSLLKNRRQMGFRIDYGLNLGKSTQLLAGFGISRAVQSMEFSVLDNDNSSYKTRSYANATQQLNSKVGKESSIFGIVNSTHFNDSLIKGSDYQLQNRFIQLHIPMGLKQTWLTVNDVKFGSTLGVQLNLVSNVQANQINLDRNAVIHIDETQAHQYYRPYFAANVDVWMEYSLSKDLAVNLAFYHGQALSSMNNKQHTYLLKPQNSGLRIGLIRNILE